MAIDLSGLQVFAQGLARARERQFQQAQQAYQLALLPYGGDLARYAQVNPQGYQQLMSVFQGQIQRQPGMHGFAFPTEPIPGPRIAPATLGRPAVAPQPLAPGGGELGSRTPPIYTPGQAAVAPQPAQYGPSPGTRIALPRPDYAQMPVSQVMPNAVQGLTRILGPNAGAIPVSQLGQLAQINPAIRLVLAQSGWGAIQGGPPSGTAGATPAAGQGPPGTAGGMPQTLGDLATATGRTLRPGVDPNTPVNALQIIDWNTGLLDPRKVTAAYPNAFDVPPTTFQEQGRALAERREARGEATVAAAPLIREADRLGTRAQTLYDRAAAAAEKNPDAFQPQWNAYRKAVDTYNAYVGQHPETQRPPMAHQSFSAPEVSQMGAQAREQQRLRRQQADIALTRLGISEMQLKNTARRLGLAEDAARDRIADRAGKLTPRETELMHLWNGPTYANLPDTDPRKQALQRQIAPIYQKLHIDLGGAAPPGPPARPGGNTPQSRREAVRYAAAAKLQTEVAALDDQIAHPEKYPGLIGADGKPDSAQIAALRMQRNQKKALLDQLSVASPVPATAGTNPGGKTITMKQLMAIAQKHNVTVTEAENQAKQQGYTVVP